MDVAIAGGHGRIALLLTRLLVGRGDRVRGLIRAPAQAPALRVAGAEPVPCDLEASDVEAAAEAIAGADAVVFAAGAGPGSGAARKLTMDRDGALLTIAAAERAGVPRFAMVSSIGTVDPPAGEDVFSVYLRAKAQADRALVASSLAWTICRPGRLTDAPGTGAVTVAPRLPHSSIPRADVAAVLAAVVHDDALAGVAFDLVAGTTPIREALRLVARVP